MKIYQQLENLFKLSIFSNEEIVPYIVKLAKMGKLDEPKKIALLTIILDRLGKMEDEEEAAKEIAILAQSGQSATFAGATKMKGLNPLPNDGVNIGVIGKESGGFSCPECGKVCKIKIALQSHMKTHKKVL